MKETTPAWLEGDICYQTGLYWRSLVHLTGLPGKKSGHRLTSIRLDFIESGIRIILKKQTPKGPKIAFLNCTDFDAALWVMSQSIKAKKLKWREDRYAMSSKLTKGK